MNLSQLGETCDLRLLCEQKHEDHFRSFINKLVIIATEGVAQVVGELVLLLKERVGLYQQRESDEFS